MTLATAAADDERCGATAPEEDETALDRAEFVDVARAEPESR